MPKPALVRRDPKEFEKAMRRMAQAPANEVFSFARYRDPEPVHPLADDARFSTVRARVGVLSTRDPLDQVSGYYSAAFKGRAFPLYAGNHDAYSSYVAYRDPADGIMRVVTLVNNGNGTTVIAAVGDPLNLLARSRSDEMPPGWQLPPGAGRPLTMEFRDGAHVERTTYFEVRDMAPADVRTFYANALASTGWTRIGDDELPSDPTDPALAFQHERDRCALQVFKGAGKAMVSITCRKTSGGDP